MKITIELTRPAWLTRPRSHRKGLTILLAVLLVAGIPVGALASDRFADVPTSSIFHDAINAIAGAGITLGCGTPNYCPSANVTREQMAAFLHRGFGRSAQGILGSFVLTATGADLSVVTIKAGEATGGTVFVRLDAFVTSFESDVTACPCQTAYLIFHDATENISSIGYNQLTTKSTISNVALDTGAISWVVAVPSGTTQTFRLSAFVLSGTGAHSAQGQLFAMTLPFGSQGTSAP
jgi:hypothetical protein